MTAAPVLAIDIGGTKTAAALVEPRGRVVPHDRGPTPNDPEMDAEVVWRSLEALLDELLADTGSPTLAGRGHRNVLGTVVSTEAPRRLAAAARGSSGLADAT